MADIDKIIDNALLLDRIEQEKQHSGKDGFYITHLGGCLRGAYYGRLAAAGLIEHVTPELDLFKYRVFKCGNMIEDFVGYCYKKHGMILEEQTRLSWPEFDLSGRLDFLVKGAEDGMSPRLVECKSVHSQKWHWDRKKGGKPSDHYMQQVAMYWRKKREEYPGLSASVLQVDKDSILAHEYVMTEEELMFWSDTGLEKARILKEAWDLKEPPPIPDTLIKEFGKWRVNWVASYCQNHALCMNDPDWRDKAELKAKVLNS